MDRRLWGCALRFILLHVLTYTAAGIIFYPVKTTQKRFRRWRRSSYSSLSPIRSRGRSDTDTDY